MSRVEEKRVNFIFDIGYLIWFFYHRKISIINRIKIFLRILSDYLSIYKYEYPRFLVRNRLWIVENNIFETKYKILIIDKIDKP